MNQPLKVAVVGASGIGKNHARWFHQHGCDVVAFVGSSPESVARTQKVLEDGFGFTGRGFTSFGEMIVATRPDIVCVSSPPPLHYGHTSTALAAGAHVLCEKPLVYDPQRSPSELVVQANTLVEQAKSRGVLLGVQMQYGPALPHFLQVAGIADAGAVQDYEMLMETKNIKENRAFKEIWIDLSPHPLSVLQKLAGPGATLEEDSIEATIAERESVAHFTVRRANGHPLTARVIVRFDPEANPPQRYFAFDGVRVAYAGRKNAAGEFVTFLTAPDGRETEIPDLVDLLVGEFVNACQGEGALPVSGEEGAQNVAWQLKIAEKA